MEFDVDSLLKYNNNNRKSNGINNLKFKGKSIYLLNDGMPINFKDDSILDSVLENQRGIYINGTFYEWEEIKHIFEEE